MLRSVLTGNFSERLPRRGPLRAHQSGPGRLLGHGQHPGGADPRQVQQARRPQEGGLGRQGEGAILIHQTELFPFSLYVELPVVLCR